MTCYIGWLLVVVFASFASAHFTLDTPPSFGFDEDKEGTAPCGGFSYSGTVTPFSPVGSVQIDSHHPQASVVINLIPGLQNVTATSTGVQVDSFTMTGLGTLCVPIATPSTLTPGNYTLQVRYNGPDGLLYQCAAIDLANGASTSSGGGSCTNSTAVSVSGGGGSSASIPASASNVSSGDVARLVTGRTLALAVAVGMTVIVTLWS